ncbi:MAG: tRNA (N(6)-L-threonylcarbamoyladenosine(37)-C(2))-methylthiotransferase, partial [Conexivisphaera sp.]
MPSYYLETYGCAANQADSDLMASVLEGAGFRSAAAPEESDVIVVNTCGVKSPTENKIVDRLARLSRMGKPLVVAGCLTKINWDRLVMSAEFGAALTPSSVHRVLEAVEAAMRDPRGRLLLDSAAPPDKPALARPRGGLIGTLEIEDGCTFSCSFCATKFSRGSTR